MPVGIAGLVLAGAGIGAATQHLGHRSGGRRRTLPPGDPRPGTPVAAVKPYGVGLTGASAELAFANFVQGPCPAPDVKYMAPMFSGGWKVAESGAAVPTDQSVNMLALPTSPFGVALNGKIGPTGGLDVSGDSNIEFMHLMLMVPLIPLGPIKTPVNVTGSADVTLHFTGTPAIGTVSGDCAGTYQATGTIAPP